MSSRSILLGRRQISPQTALSNSISRSLLYIVYTEAGTVHVCIRLMWDSSLELFGFSAEPSRCVLPVMSIKGESVCWGRCLFPGCLRLSSIQSDFTARPPLHPARVPLSKLSWWETLFPLAVMLLVSGLVSVCLTIGVFVVDPTYVIANQSLTKDQN